MKLLIKVVEDDNINFGATYHMFLSNKIRRKKGKIIDRRRVGRE